MATTTTIIRTLNDERPTWATHGVVILYDSSGGNSPESECTDATVAWCTSAEEMERAVDLAVAISSNLSDQPSIVRLINLATCRYHLVVEHYEEGNEASAIEIEEMDAAPGL